MVVVLGFCPSLGVPLGDRLSSGDEALDVAEKVAGKVGVCDHFNDALVEAIFQRGIFCKYNHKCAVCYFSGHGLNGLPGWQEGEGRLVSLCRLVGFRFLQVFDSH